MYSDVHLGQLVEQVQFLYDQRKKWIIPVLPRTFKYVDRDAKVAYLRQVLRSVKDDHNITDAEIQVTVETVDSDDANTGLPPPVTGPQAV